MALHLIGKLFLLKIEANVQYVAVLHDVFFAFQTQLAFGFSLHHTAKCHQIIVGNDLGADETLLQVRMDLTGGLRRGGAAVNCPGTALISAGGEEGLQAQQIVRETDHAVEAGFFNVVFL